MKNIALVYGGEGSESQISELSKNFLKTQIDSSQFNLKEFLITKDFDFINNGKIFYLNKNNFNSKDENWKVDYIIPCIHGYPGETGDLQSLLEAYKVPFLGCQSEASKVCFNKVLTKLMLEHFGIETTPFISLFKNDDISRAHQFLKHHQEVFIKASNQGSSIGCFHVKTEDELDSSLQKAFQFSDYIVVEKYLKAEKIKVKKKVREIEVAAFEFQDKLYISHPGEISLTQGFYDYDEKYSDNSKARIDSKAQLNQDIVQKINEISKKVFKCLNLKDLSRIDFFLDHDKIYVNEINTFPGMTEISLFPKMLIESGVNFKDFISDRINKGT